jgi:HD superfamily phosphohydrolase YqeK
MNTGDDITFIADYLEQNRDQVLSRWRDA